MVEKSMLDLLFAKETAVRQMTQELKGRVNFDAAIREVNRQQRQISTGHQGNPITGEGITKSGSHD